MSKNCRLGYFQGHQTRNFEKRPKKNNKAWIKLSEAILSILGDFWKKYICSLFPARLMEELPASKVLLQPATCLTGEFPSRRICRHRADIDIGQNSALQWWRGVLIENWVWYKGEIHPFSYGGRKGKRLLTNSTYSYSRHQITSDTLNCLFPTTFSFQAHIIYSKSPSQRTFACRTVILRDRSIGCPCTLRWCNVF